MLERGAHIIVLALTKACVCLDEYTLYGIIIRYLILSQPSLYMHTFAKLWHIYMYTLKCTFNCTSRCAGLSLHNPRTLMCAVTMGEPNANKLLSGATGYPHRAYCFNFQCCLVGHDILGRLAMSRGTVWNCGHPYQEPWRHAKHRGCPWHWPKHLYDAKPADYRPSLDSSFNPGAVQQRLEHLVYTNNHHHNRLCESHHHLHTALPRYRAWLSSLPFIAVVCEGLQLSNTRDPCRDYSIWSSPGQVFIITWAITVYRSPRNIALVELRALPY